MTTSPNGIDDLPHEVALPIAVFLAGATVWVLLTGFHPAWKRIIHWAYRQKGPPVTPTGRVVAAANMTAWAAYFLAMSYQLSSVFSVLRIVVGILCTALFVAIGHDYLKWKRS
jgi:hypothetical protein